MTAEDHDEHLATIIRMDERVSLLLQTVEIIEKDVRRLQQDVEALKMQRAHIVGVGSALSFGMIAVTYFSTDTIRRAIKAIFNL